MTGRMRVGVPSSLEARHFYNCALQRFEDAQILLRWERTTAAVYLAGYGIECILKAMVLSAVPQTKTAAELHFFRGHRAHDYEWLRKKYYEHRGPHFPREINVHFTLVSDWSTDLRYRPGKMSMGDAEDFLSAARTIIEFAKGRL